METVKFSYNWNNKLNNKCFTTFRIWNPRKYTKDSLIVVELWEKKIITMKYEARIIESLPCKLNVLPVFLTYLDSGYGVEEFIKLVRTIYKNTKLDLDNTTFCFYLLKKV